MNISNVSARDALRETDHAPLRADAGGIGPFDALLQTTTAARRTVVDPKPASPRDTDDPASKGISPLAGRLRAPQEVFEERAAGHTGRQRRRTALVEDVRDNATAPFDGGDARVSVEARERLSAYRAPNEPAGTQPNHPSQDSSKGRALESSNAARSTTAAADGTLLHQSAKSVRNGNGLATNDVHRPATSPESAAAARLSTPDSTIQPGAAVSTSGGIQDLKPAAGGGVSEARPSSTSANAKPAEQVAQVLKSSIQLSSPDAARNAALNLSKGRMAESTWRALSSPDQSSEPNRTAAADETEPAPFDRLIRSLRLRLGDHHSTARLLLDPPELGPMKVDVRMDPDGIRIDVSTENEAARNLLQDRAGELRTALAQHGIHIEHLEVFVANPASPRRADDDRASKRRDNNLPTSNNASTRLGGEAIVVSSRSLLARKRLDLRV